MTKTRILAVLVFVLGAAAPSHAYFEELVKKFETDMVTQLSIFRELVTGITLELESKLKDQKQQTPEAIAKWFDLMREDFKKKSEHAIAGVSGSQYLSEKFKSLLLKIISDQLKRLDALRQKLQPQKTPQEPSASQAVAANL